MTPQERYTKALSIPVGEWAKFMQDNGFAPGWPSWDDSRGFELIYPGSRMTMIGIVPSKLLDFIDSYAPEVELVWDVTFAHAERYEATVVGHKFSIVVRLNETRGLWEWWMYGGSEGMAMKCGDDHEKLPAISAAKAAARELIKSVLKPG